MMYSNLKRVWSHNDMNYIPKFRETFPELNKVSSEELADRFCDLGIDFYTTTEKSVGKIIRFTLPFAVLLMIIMFIFLPINFMIKGKWGYGYNKNNRILNWFKSLRLL